MHFGNSHFDGPLSPLGLPLLGRKGHLHQICPSPASGKLSLSDLPRKMVIIHLKNQTQTHHSLPKQLLITKLKSHVSGSSCFCQERSVCWEGLPSRRSGTENSMSWNFPSCRWKLSCLQTPATGLWKSRFIIPRSPASLWSLSLLLSGNFGFCIAHDAEGIRVKKTNKKHFKSSFAKSKSSW